MFQTVIAADRASSAGELTRVEEFFGQDSLIPLDFPVVSRGIRLGPLMPCLVADGPGEVIGAVAGAVVGHDPMDVIDAVGGQASEQRSCPACGCSPRRDGGSVGASA